MADNDDAPITHHEHETAHMHRIGGALEPSKTVSAAGDPATTGVLETTAREDHAHGSELTLLKTDVQEDIADKWVTAGNELVILTDTFTPTRDRLVLITANTTIRQAHTFIPGAGTCAGSVIIRVDGVDSPNPTRWQNFGIDCVITSIASWNMILDDTSHTVELVVNNDFASADDVYAANSILTIDILGETP